jgi:hypothetical protein
MQIYPQSKWQTMARDHDLAVSPLVEEFQSRKQRNQKHPVYDFLFDYYQCNRRHLLEWHPGFGVILEGSSAQAWLRNPHYISGPEGVYLDPACITPKIRTRAKWIHNLLQMALKRESRFTCFGLHEWAMLYRAQNRRHPDTPLRVSQQTIDATVEALPINCTHYDAFRFFSDPAKPLNARYLDHEDRSENEQFGCLHFAMDLYKWCYKLAPFISSELTREAFLLGIRAREMDMQASPYDVAEFGLPAVDITSAQGRASYVAFQKDIERKARELALAIRDTVKQLLKIPPSAENLMQDQAGMQRHAQL